jgi:integrase
MQFETTLRQEDVIGEWEPIPDGEPASGIVLGGRRWVGGLTWGHLDSDLVLRKATIKTGAEVQHDLRACPLVLDILSEIPAEQRVGPIIVDEKAGRPYAEDVYSREWRIAANAAGLPKHIQNRDARAGGVSEADEAGPRLEEIQAQTGHTQEKTTRRYLRGESLGKSQRTAELRVAHRATRNKG